jgi:hypothetical protein
METPLISKENSPSQASFANMKGIEGGITLYLLSQNDECQRYQMS